jgi:hypothetical protein
VYIRDDPLFPILPGVNFTDDGALVDSWLWIPRLKGRTNVSLFFLFFGDLVAMVKKRYGLRLFLILSYAFDCKFSLAFCVISIRVNLTTRL